MSMRNSFAPEFVPEMSRPAATPVREKTFRREKFYQATICLLLLWNWYLQLSITFTSAHYSSDHSMLSSYSSQSRTWTADASNFIDPHTSSIIAQPLKPADLNSKTPIPAETPATSATPVDTAASNVTSTSEVAPMPSSNVTLANASLLPLEVATTTVAPEISTAATTPTVTATTAAPSLSPAAQAVSAADVAISYIPLGQACSSKFKNDRVIASCDSVCNAQYFKAHCQRCKCRGCTFCPHVALPPAAAASEAPPALDALAPEAGAAPPLQLLGAAEAAVNASSHGAASDVHAGSAAPSVAEAATPPASAAAVATNASAPDAMAAAATPIS